MLYRRRRVPDTHGNPSAVAAITTIFHHSMHLTLCHAKPFALPQMQNTISFFSILSWPLLRCKNLAVVRLESPIYPSAVLSGASHRRPRCRPGADALTFFIYLCAPTRYVKFWKELSVLQSCLQSDVRSSR